MQTMFIVKLRKKLCCFTAFQFVILLLIFNSCSIRITEKTILGNYYKIPYDSTRISRYIKNISDSSFVAAIKTLPNKKINILYKDDNLTIIRDYTFINDTVSLEYFVFLPQNITQTVYVFCGYGELSIGIFQNIMKLAKNNNAKVICLSYSGYGNSTGAFSINKQFGYNQIFYEKLKTENIGNLSIIGYSMGSLYATSLAVDNHVDNLILLAPISDGKDFLKYMKHSNTKGIYKLFSPFIKLNVEDNLMKISNVEKLQKFEGNVELFHAKDDRTLPFTMSEKLYQSSISSNKNLTFFDTGGHAASFQKENWDKIVELIFSKTGN